MPSFQNILNWLAAIPVPSPFPASLSPYTSCSSPHLSCHRPGEELNTCCYATPGGQFLQTQFWDASPAIGPNTSWTIHGLWPDHCSGGFDQFCDSSRHYTNISDILTSCSHHETLDYMRQYWKSWKGNDEVLWQHEWNKHGTCISTLEPKCYDTNDENYTDQLEVAHYFEATVNLFKTRDSYAILAAAGVLPSHAHLYTIEEIQEPLMKAHGAPVTVGCHGTRLSEIWYHFNVRGSVQEGEWVPALPDGMKKGCPATGIEYLPKEERARPSPTATTSAVVSPTRTAVPRPFTGRGNIVVEVDGKANGCLITQGFWYNSGSCATFRAQNDVKELDGDEESHLFTLATSKGICSMMDGVFECARDLPKQTVFEGGENGTLAYRGRTSFWADNVPRRFKKERISCDAEKDDDIEVRLVWKAV